MRVLAASRVMACVIACVIACVLASACGRSPIDSALTGSDTARDLGDIGSDFEVNSGVAPSAPRNVRASIDLPGLVELRFDPPSRGRPTEYRVLRDGVLVATLPWDIGVYRDLDAEAGGFGPPTELVASQGDFDDRVELRWNAPSSSPGRAYTYTVVAFTKKAASAPSEAARGFRAAPTITHYEVSTDGEQSFRALLGDATSYTDTNIPPATIEPGEVYLDALFDPAGVVRLQVQGSGVRQHDVYYRVRAVSDDVPGESSEAALGFRKLVPSALRYQWQRALGEGAGDDVDDHDDDAFVDLPNVTGPAWFDESLPPDSVARYRVRVSMGSGSGEASAVSAAKIVRAKPRVIDAAGDRIARCVITEDERLHCWNTAVAIPEDMSFAQVSTAYGRICAITPAGHMYCWGGSSDTYRPAGPSSTAYLQISLAGTGTCMLRRDDRRVECRDTYPFASAPKGSFDTVRMADDGVCGLRTDGRLLCSWTYGNKPLSEPTDERFIAMHHEYDHVWAVDEDGGLWAWHYTQTPVVPLGAEALRFVDTSTKCALQAGGQLWCWPRGPLQAPVHVTERSYQDLIGECGIRTDGRVDCGSDLWASPLPPSMPGEGVLMLSGETCLLGTDHELLCTTTPRLLTDLPEAERPTHVRTVFEHYPRACVLHDDGSLQCWATGLQYDPLPLLPEDERYAHVVSARYMLCGLRFDGLLRCSSVANLTRPPPALSTERFSDLVGGDYHACALDEERRLSCWGTGVGALPPPEATALPVLALTAGGNHGCVVREDHKLVCWGDDTRGQAPTGPRTTRLVSLTAGYAHTCGLDDEGAVECWGDARGWTGSSLGRYRMLAASGADTCGLRDDGKLVCWGTPYSAQDGLPLVTP